jgi:hypothetical protein
MQIVGRNDLGDMVGVEDGSCGEWAGRDVQCLHMQTGDGDADADVIC